VQEIIVSLARRSIQSSFYNIASHGLQVIILFFRSVMLARILPPAVFGVYTFVQAIVSITVTLPTFGLGSAYTHRSPESEHPDAPGVYFTLISIFSLIWAVLLTGIAVLFFNLEQVWVLAVMVAAAFVSQLVAPAQAILAKQVLFQRLAILEGISAILTTLCALLLAWNGAGIWSLLSVDIISVIVLVVGLYLIHPVWRPRLAWSPPVVRYFLKFGSSTFLAGLLVQAIDRLDDVWTGRFLGDVALGFYSRAYTFANYPRRILASPVSSVALVAYAEVKYDRKRLSQAFFRVNALMIRAGFLFAGILFLISPEFVRLVLGEKWLPMLSAFRLMIVYTAIDPIKFTVGHLFVSIGMPGLLARTRFIQLLILAIGLVTLGPTYGIAGVSLAATIMVVIGMGILLWQAREHVDFSVVRLFGMPVVALIIALLAAYGAVALYGSTDSFWQVGILKFVAFGLAYSLIMLVTEKHQIYELAHLVRHLFLNRKPTTIAQDD
jgi:O-antigen/teichoic acid export membrane protein